MKEEIFHNRVVEFGIGAIDENTIDFIKYSGSFFLSACASATSDSGGDRRLLCRQSKVMFRTQK